MLAYNKLTHIENREKNFHRKLSTFLSREKRTKTSASVTMVDRQTELEITRLIWLPWCVKYEGMQKLHCSKIFTYKTPISLI